MLRPMDQENIDVAKKIKTTTKLENSPSDIVMYDHKEKIYSAMEISCTLASMYVEK